VANGTSPDERLGDGADLDRRLDAGEAAARLVIDLIAEAATDVALTIGYLVPGAAWRPYHRAVLEFVAQRERYWPAAR